MFKTVTLLIFSELQENEKLRDGVVEVTADEAAGEEGIVDVTKRR